MYYLMEGPIGTHKYRFPGPKDPAPSGGNFSRVNFDKKKAANNSLYAVNIISITTTKKS